MKKITLSKETLRTLESPRLAAGVAVLTKTTPLTFCFRCPTRLECTNAVVCATDLPCG